MIEGHVYENGSHTLSGYVAVFLTAENAEKDKCMFLAKAKAKQEKAEDAEKCKGIFWSWENKRKEKKRIWFSSANLCGSLPALHSIAADERLCG